MKVRFLGSGDARLLVDCGASSLVAMRRFGVDPQSVDTVVLSHLHGDHFGGVPFLVLDGQFKRRTQPLTIAGPPGVAARVTAAMEVLFPGSSAVERKFAVRFVELRDRMPLPLGAFTVTPFELVPASAAPPYALRVAAGGKVVAYSGDTEWTDALLEAAREADLFIAEALFFDKRVKYHLDFTTLAAERPRLACRRVVLTHMGEDMLRRVGELGVEAAEDGRELVV